MSSDLSILYDSTLPSAPNPPLLPTVAYRVDDYSTLRHRLLASLQAAFPEWNPDLLDQESSQDYATTLIEIFAYLGDILGFYQDARANEMFLGTAKLSTSLKELGRLIDYVPAPGSAATTWQVFHLKDGKTGTIPAGYQLKSLATDRVAAQVFETAADLDADAAWNSLAHVGHDRSARTLDPTRETSALLSTTLDGLEAGQALVFAPAEGMALPAILHSVSVEDERSRIGWDAPRGIVAGELPIADLVIHAAPTQTMRLADRERADELTAGLSWLTVEADNLSGEFPPPALHHGRPVLMISEGLMFAARLVCDRTVAGVIQLNRCFNVSLRRSRTRVYPAAKVAVADLATARPRPGDMDIAATLAPGASSETIAGAQLLISDAIGVVRVLGAGAGDGKVYLAEPLPRMLRPSQSLTIDIYAAEVATTGSSDERERSYAVSPERIAPATREMVLDKTYDGLEAEAFVVVEDGEQPPRALRVAAVVMDAEERTVLQLTDAVGADFRTAKLRVHGPFAAQARIDGFDVSEATLATGATQLEIDASLPNLAAGAYLALDDGAHAEVARVTTVTLGESTIVDLEEPLQNEYALAALAIHANVVGVSHGKTVEEPTLGSGDQSLAWQSFRLHDGPVTYLHDAMADRGASSTLEVLVDGARWAEVRSLAESGAADRHYVTEVEADGITRIQFGDGVHGSKLPTGQANVAVRYRVGLGTDGNVAARAITLMPDPLDFIASTFNPVGAAGGADAETDAEIRRLAPVTVRTLDRIVSLADYADLALSYAGIGKARADWAWLAGERRVVLTLATADGGALTFAAELRAFLDARRTGEQRLEIRDYRPIPVAIDLEVRVRENYLRLETVERIRATLGADEGGYFAFADRDLGEDLHLSDVYRRVEAVDGVDYLVVTTFCSSEDPAGSLLDCVTIPPDGLAIGGHPTETNSGLLRIKATGGIR